MKQLVLAAALSFAAIPAMASTTTIFTVPNASPITAGGHNVTEPWVSENTANVVQISNPSYEKLNFFITVCTGCPGIKLYCGDSKTPITVAAGSFALCKTHHNISWESASTTSSASGSFNLHY